MSQYGKQYLFQISILVTFCLPYPSKYKEEVTSLIPSPPPFPTNGKTKVACRFFRQKIHLQGQKRFFLVHFAFQRADYLANKLLFARVIEKVLFAVLISKINSYF